MKIALIPVVLLVLLMSLIYLSTIGIIGIEMKNVIQLKKEKDAGDKPFIEFLEKNL
ncbi:hypothetical protein [Solidesulfovibrio alcoholivorans]|uniref:hypothetical protein n=1 Tax=Solidesulfovibrio alcoholivorans TaxID=81406 RepID=UPI000AC69BBA|nr:hypothetical protein [Solidesulfovibrio alcoholivorans]